MDNTTIFAMVFWCDHKIDFAGFPYILKLEDGLIKVKIYVCWFIYLTHIYWVPSKWQALCIRELRGWGTKTKQTGHLCIIVSAEDGHLNHLQSKRDRNVFKSYIMEILLVRDFFNSTKLQEEEMVKWNSVWLMLSVLYKILSLRAPKLQNGFQNL